MCHSYGTFSWPIRTVFFKRHRLWVRPTAGSTLELRTILHCSDGGKKMSGGRMKRIRGEAKKAARSSSHHSSRRPISESQHSSTAASIHPHLAKMKHRRTTAAADRFARVTSGWNLRRRSNNDRNSYWHVKQFVFYRTTKSRECPYVILLPFRSKAFYNRTPCPRKLTFKYNSILNFIQVSFCFLLFLGLGLGSVIGLGLGFRV